MSFTDNHRNQFNKHELDNNEAFKEMDRNIANILSTFQDIIDLLIERVMRLVKDVEYLKAKIESEIDGNR